MREFYTIYHITDIYDGGSYGPTQKMTNLGMVEATPEEIEAFIEYWNKPRVYYHMYDKLYEHRVTAVKVKKTDLNTIEPYDPKTRDWPDIPYGMDFTMEWDPESKTWKQPI